MDSRIESSGYSMANSSHDVCCSTVPPSGVAKQKRLGDDRSMNWKLLDGGQIEEDDVDEEALPVGNHLVVDFQGVDKAFLMSEELLLEAMVDLASTLDAFEMSHYFCHDSSLNATMTCGGASRRNDHIWIHTRPEDGVLFMDMFVAGMGNEVLSIVPTVERILGRPEGNDGTAISKPSMRWLNKARGFHDMLDESDAIALTDLQWYPVGMLVDYKKEVRQFRKNLQPVLSQGSITYLHLTVVCTSLMTFLGCLSEKQFPAYQCLGRDCAVTWVRRGIRTVVDGRRWLPVHPPGMVFTRSNGLPRWLASIPEGW
jgi:S-adenosylmethionine decarboxylase